jgi:hypothetical protein
MCEFTTDNKWAPEPPEPTEEMAQMVNDIIEKEGQEHAEQIRKEHNPDIRYDRVSNTALTKFHQVTFALRGERKFGWHLYNILAVTFLIGLMSSFSALLRFDDVEARLNVVIFVVLTFIVYKTWIADYLPRIEYITYLDRYLLVAVPVVVIFWTVELIVLLQFCGEESDEPDEATHSSGNLSFNASSFGTRRILMSTSSTNGRNGLRGGGSSGVPQGAGQEGGETALTHYDGFWEREEKCERWDNWVGIIFAIVSWHALTNGPQP